MIAELKLDNVAMERIAQLRAFAEANPLTSEYLTLLARDFDPEDPTTRGPRAIGIGPEFNVELGDFRVTFTIEQQPVGLCRHISISVPSSAGFPPAPGLAIIMPLFGFTPPGANTFGWGERYAAGFVAANVVQTLDGSPIERTTH